MNDLQTETTFQVKCLGYREIVNALKGYRDSGYTVNCALNADKATVTNELVRLRMVEATYVPETSDYDTWEQANMEMYQELDNQSNQGEVKEALAEETWVVNVPFDAANNNRKLRATESTDPLDHRLDSRTVFASACKIPVDYKALVARIEAVQAESERPLADLENADNTFVTHVMPGRPNNNVELGYLSTFMISYNKGAGSANSAAYYAPACDVMQGWQEATCDVLDRLACAVSCKEMYDGKRYVRADALPYSYAEASETAYYWLDPLKQEMVLDSSHLESSLKSDLTCDVLGSWYSCYCMLPGIDANHTELGHITFFTKNTLLIPELLPESFSLRSSFLHRLRHLSAA